MIKRLVYLEGPKTYTGSDGKEHLSRNYFLELSNGRLIAVRPSFDDDKKVFALLAEKY